MYRRTLCLVLFILVEVNYVIASKYDNVTLEPASRQLLDFKLYHRNPVGVITVSSGAPVDIRDTFTLNSDILSRQFNLEALLHTEAERVPERIVHAKGTGAHGYFEVTNDVSKYTCADVFNGIGKKTPVLGRFSVGIQNAGGTDLARENRGLALKMYTKEGNLDFLSLHLPFYLYKDPILFIPFVHAFKRNPRTHLFDNNAVWDLVTLRPEILLGFLYLLSDYGITNGYRKMDIFPLHTYEVTNKYRQKHYVRFNFRSEQGIEFLNSTQAAAIQAVDLDYYIRDLYNAIERKDYPKWRLEMDVMTPHDIQTVDYDPFDLTRMWRNGTFKRVEIGQLVFNKIPDNHFRDIELSAFNPTNLVPGIPGPRDELFRSRRIAYIDAQNYRLGRNHNKILANTPRYAKTYNRDSVPPVWDNENDVPNYYPNSFNGPVPFVDSSRSGERLVVYESNAVDLQPAADFYNDMLQDDESKDRLANVIGTTLQTVTPKITKRVIKLLYLVDEDLGHRTTVAFETLLRNSRTST